MYVSVRVIAGAKREALEQVSKDHFKISVREKAERNMANRRVQELVAAHFGVPARQVRLISGHRSPAKLFSLPD